MAKSGTCIDNICKISTVFTSISGCHQDNIKMETRSTETAEFLKFFDNDFDIVNGYGVFNTHGKVLKTGVDVMYIRANYIHTEFWYNAIKHVCQRRIR